MRNFVLLFACLFLLGSCSNGLHTEQASNQSPAPQFAGDAGFFDWLTDLFKKKPETKPTPTPTPKPNAAVITEHPRDIQIDEGFDTSLSVTVNRGAQFQWMLNGQNIEGANGRILELQDIQREQDGMYTVRVSYDGKSEVSRGARVQVIQNAVTDTRQFSERVFAGYQAWFASPNDGVLGEWLHWAHERPAPGNVRFELFPDTREYDPGDLFDTNLGPLGDGRPTKLFASARESVIYTHYRWLREYGLDGFALQRFITVLQSSSRARAWRDDITAKVKRQAEAWGKNFYIMYDLTGARGANLHDFIKSDWLGMESSMGLTASSAHAREDGRPVVALWGIGNGQNSLSHDQALDLIRWFKNRGVFVYGGLPYMWRNHPEFLDVYSELNMISPWAVGAFSTDDDVRNHHQLALDDKRFCNERGIKYQKVIWPGFAWSNWNGGARNAYPRRAGEFFWTQAFYASLIKGGAYIAMFDEYDEGTAIAKSAENSSMIPNNQYFLTLDADGRSLSSDFYLRLAGQAAHMIKGERSRTKRIPIPDR